MVLSREDWIKYEQDWPANVKKREKEKEEKKKEEEERKKDENEQTDHDAEENWRRGCGDPSEKHHGAYGDESKGQDKENSQSNGNDSKETDGDDINQNKRPNTEYQKLRERYSPQEITLLRHLQRERAYAAGLEQNEGTHVSPIKKRARETPISM